MNTLRKALRVIDHIVKAPSGVTATEIAAACNMSLPNAYKYLKVLEEHGFVVRKPDKTYIPSFKFVEYSSTILRRFDVRDLSSQDLVELMVQTGQTVHLILKDGFEGVYINKVEGVHSLPMVSKIGMKVSLYSTSAGKAILAYLPKEELEEYLSAVPLKKKTENTITVPEKLIAELERIRAVGYAVDNEENEPGIRCIGAAVLNHEGYPVAAVSISGAARKLDDLWIRENAQYVALCAQRISAKLGYAGKRQHVDGSEK